MLGSTVGYVEISHLGNVTKSPKESIADTLHKSFFKSQIGLNTKLS